MKTREPRPFGVVDDYFVNQIEELLNRRDLLKELGHWPRQNRTDTDAVDYFGVQYNYLIEDGTKFPLLLVKNTHWKSVVHELIWFLRGDTNTKYLNDNGVTIWDEWKDSNGDLGPVYGKQWRSWPGGKKNIDGSTPPIDQLLIAINQIKENPSSRRIIVSAWNPAELHLMALPPCHCFFQFHVDHDGLSLQMYQRSADWFLGVPFNVASYALLLMIVAKMTGLRAHRFIHTIGSVHLYENHFSEARKLASDYLEKSTADYSNSSLPIVRISDRVAGLKDISEITFEDIVLENYDPWPAVKAEVAV